MRVRSIQKKIRVKRIRIKGVGSCYGAEPHVENVGHMSRGEFLSHLANKYPEIEQRNKDMQEENRKLRFMRKQAGIVKVKSIKKKKRTLKVKRIIK